MTFIDEGFHLYNQSSAEFTCLNLLEIYFKYKLLYYIQRSGVGSMFPCLI